MDVVNEDADKSKAQVITLLRFQDVVELMEKHGAERNLAPPVKQQLFQRITKACWTSSNNLQTTQLLYDENIVLKILQE